MKQNEEFLSKSLKESMKQNKLLKVAAERQKKQNNNLRAFLGKHHPEERSIQAVMESNLGSGGKHDKSINLTKLPGGQHEVQTAGPSLDRDREGNQFSMAMQIRNTDPNQTIAEGNS